MCDFEITATVDSGDIDMVDLIMNQARFKVKHSAGACGPCRSNHNPALVPFPGCRSNQRPGDVNGCKCSVDIEIVQVG